MVYDVSTKTLKALDIEGDHPEWAPDNARLAYDHNGNVHVYDPRRGSASVIGQGTRPWWSSSGESVVALARFNHVDLINVTTGERVELLADAGAWVPRWSPNGRWMMFTVAGGRWWSIGDAATERRDIIVRDTKTGGEAVVGVFAKGNDADYTWTTNPALCKREP